MTIFELGTVEQAVLYLGAYELKNSIEVPYKVVMNEALEIAKLYGAEGAFKLVNASLDKLAQSQRQFFQHLYRGYTSI
jgi:N utilization substance protein B